LRPKGDGALQLPSIDHMLAIRHDQTVLSVRDKYTNPISDVSAKIHICMYYLRS